MQSSVMGSCGHQAEGLNGVPELFMTEYSNGSSCSPAERVQKDLHCHKSSLVQHTFLTIIFKNSTLRAPCPAPAGVFQNSVQSLHASKISRFSRHEHSERPKHDNARTMRISRHFAELLSAQGRSLLQFSPGSATTI